MSHVVWLLARLIHTLKDISYFALSEDVVVPLKSDEQISTYLNAIVEL